MWWHHDWSSWNWFFMVVSMALFWGLVIGGIVWGLRAVGKGAGASAHGESARDTLDRRFARGEISEEEYRRYRDALSEK